jgi:hypothetical protein
MGLDIESRDFPTGEEAEAFARENTTVDLVRAFAEAAIQKALEQKQTHLSFATPEDMRGKDQDLAELCGELKKKYPALVEIVPHLAAAGAVAYLGKKPNAAAKLLHRLKPTDI